MSEWLKKKLERDRANAEVELQRQKTIGVKAPVLWGKVQAELKECADLFQAQYPNGVAYEYTPDNRIEMRRTDGQGTLEVIFDPAHQTISYLYKGPAGTNEGLLNMDLNDRKECYLRQGADRYETMDDLSAFLLGTILS